jgi:hypothetical protein
MDINAPQGGDIENRWGQYLAKSSYHNDIGMQCG